MKHWPSDKDDKPNRRLLAEGYVWLVLLILGAIAMMVVWAAPAFAHGGGLAADGCHMDRSTGVGTVKLTALWFVRGQIHHT